ncbi:MAG TPA: LytTR family DNA-binding domain-containing protein [Gemmatimonadaceae bacterium]|jgi:two-component system LytT family response regulator
MKEKLRVLIVDDERLARHHLARLLEQIDDIECVGEAPNADAALAAVRASRPDVMLLDIQMPGVGGFALLDALPRESQPAVIFVTAHDHYAVKAFEVHATDYLLKPPDPDRLRDALESARSRLQSREFAAEQKRLRALVERLTRSNGTNEIVIGDRGRTVRIPAVDIDWIRAEDNYVRIHAGGQTYLMRERIGALEKSLDPARFVRIHRSAIVNIDRVRELRHSLRGGHIVVLENGEKLRVSRAYRKAVIEMFKSLAARSAAPVATR